MKEIEKISAFQFFILVLMFVVGSAILYIPTVLAASAKNDAWIVGIVGGILGVGVATLYVKVSENLEGQDMVEIYQAVFGTILGTFFTILFCVYCLIISALMLRGIGDFMVTQIMPDTPIEILMGMFVFFVMVAQKYGVEVFSRTAEIFFPWILFLFFFGVLIIVPDVQFSRVFPILENGIKPILNGTFSYLGFPYFECVILLMIIPYCRNQQQARKSWLFGTLGGAVILFIPVFLSILIFGYEVTMTQPYATYVLAKKMGIPKALERMEVIIAIFWILTIYYKLLISSFSLTKSIEQMLKLDNEKILIYPIGILIFCLSIISGDNIVYLNHFSSFVWPSIALQTGFILPIVILLLLKLKKKISKSN